MGDSWIVDNLNAALNTWNGKLAEIWQLLTESPQTFRGGQVWSVMVGIHGALQAIGYGLLVLFFAIGVVKTCGSFVEVKRPEHALKLFIRFALAKAAVTYGLELMQAVFSIVQGTVSTVITQSGTSGIKVPPLPVTPNRAVVYARTADRHVGVLETQYNSVLAAAREDGCIVVDAAIEHCLGNNLKKPGLLRLLKLVRKGEANVLYVQDLSRLHGSPFWLYLLFCWMQDHNAKIVTVACDIRYSLHYDLHIEQKLLERAARKGRDVPWIV